MTSITPTQLEIIESLLFQEEPQNIRGLARKLKKSYPLVYNNLEALRKKEWISKKNVPPTQIISLTPSLPTEIKIEVEKHHTHKLTSKYPWIKLFLKDLLTKVESTFFILLIFGSYAKGKENAGSDLDLLAIAPRKEEIKLLEEAILKIHTKIKKQVIVVEENEFLEMTKNHQQFNVGNEAVKQHLLLYGSEQFYTLLNRK